MSRGLSISWHTFFQFMKKDLLMFRREYFSKFFDTCFLFFTNVIVFSYFMPIMGLQSTYGSFILIGAIASFGLFDVIGHVATLIGDIEGDKTIQFPLAMPISSTLVFMQIALRWAINSFILTLLLFPIGKILLPYEYKILEMNFLKLIPMYITINVFFGFFSLWIASLIKSISSLSSLYLRVVNPIFMFGGYFYTWESLYTLSPTLAYINLIDPMLYVFEGMRSAALGSEGYLPFWNCFLALWGFILVTGYLGIRRLKKRLDVV